MEDRHVYGSRFCSTPPPFRAGEKCPGSFFPPAFRQRSGGARQQFSVRSLQPHPSSLLPHFCHICLATHAICPLGAVRCSTAVSSRRLSTAPRGLVAGLCWGVWGDIAPRYSTASPPRQRRRVISPRYGCPCGGPPSCILRAEPSLCRTAGAWRRPARLCRPCAFLPPAPWRIC